MWGIGFPANRQRGCVCLSPNPNALQRWLQRVWSGLSRAPTQTFSSFSASLTHVRARTRTRAHAGLPNRNTQHAVSWPPSLGFGWREAQFSTPVFGAVIRGLFYFQERVAHTHVLWSTQREHWWIQSTLQHLLGNKWRVSVIVESSKRSVDAHIFPVPAHQRAQSCSTHHRDMTDMTDSYTLGYSSGNIGCLLVTLSF